MFDSKYFRGNLLPVQEGALSLRAMSTAISGESIQISLHAALSADLKAPRAHPLISNMTARRALSGMYMEPAGVSPSRLNFLSFRRRWSKKNRERWEMFYINYSEYFVFCKRDEHQLYGSKIVPSFRLPFSGAESVMDGAALLSARVSACLPAPTIYLYDDLLVLWCTTGMEESKTCL